MTRRIGCFILSLVAVWGLSAQEFQVDSGTNLGWSTVPGSGFSIGERIDGTYSLPLDLKGGSFNLKAHARAGWPADLAADLDILSVTLAFQKPADDLKALKWTLGRFSLGEPTGLILNHPGDGSKLVLQYGPVDLTVITAFTGFVLRSSSSISLTRADQSASDTLLASPRFIGSVDGSLKIFGDHQLTFGALAQQDLNGRDRWLEEGAMTQDNLKGGAVDTQYLTLKGDGPVVDGLFYEAFTTLGTGSTLSWIEDKTATSGSVYRYKPVVAFLLGGALSYYLPEFLSSSVTARILAASGDNDANSTVEGNTKGDANLFVPITPTSLGVVFNPALANLVFYELGGTLKPVPGLPLVAGAKLLAFQRASDGVVSAPGVLRSGPVWMGEELDVTASWRPFSDLSVNAAFGAFLPTAGTFVSGSPGAGFQYAVTVGANLSL